MQPNGPPGLPPADGRPAFLRQYRWRSWSRCCRCLHKARCSGIGSCFPHKLGNIDAIAEQQCRVPSARIGRGPSNVEVLLRRSTHNQCGVDGRGQDYFFSNIKNIAGVGENLREDASFRRPGKCRISAALRPCWGGGTAQFPIRKVGSTTGGNIGHAAMERGCKKETSRSGTGAAWTQAVYLRITRRRGPCARCDVCIRWLGDTASALLGPGFGFRGG